MNQKKKTMIIKGDLSGIQEFIFNIPSKGAARMLKARSFFVQVIVELAVEKIKLFCQNKDFEVINKSGGSFFIKLKDSPDEFLPLIAEFNKSLAKHGLYLSLVHTEEKSDWSETLKSLKIEEEVQKFQRYNEMPEVFEAAQSTFFDDDRDIWKNLAKKFAFAKSYKILEKQKKSQIQSDAISMGGLTLQLFENEQEGAILFNSENTPLSILKEVPQWDTSNPYYKLVKSAGDQSNLVQKWEQEVKEGEEIRRGELITLSHLGKQAKLRTGTDKLGVLKIDVDNLGNHFVGCKSQKAYQELSMRFDKFFGNDLKELWEGGDFCCKQGHVHTFKDNILIKTVAKHPSHKDVVVII